MRETGIEHLLQELDRVGESSCGGPLPPARLVAERRVEWMVFDIDRMRAEMDRDLPRALRDLADEIEAGVVTGHLLDVVPNESARSVERDRARLLLRLAISAPVRLAVAVTE